MLSVVTVDDAVAAFGSNNWMRLLGSFNFIIAVAYGKLKRHSYSSIFRWWWAFIVLKISNKSVAAAITNLISGMFVMFVRTLLKNISRCIQNAERGPTLEKYNSPNLHIHSLPSRPWCHWERARMYVGRCPIEQDMQLHVTSASS